MTSAYPLPADVLTARVRQMVDEDGEVPSQRRVIKACHVSAKRAAGAIATVRRELARTVPALHVVHDERTETHLESGDERTQQHPGEADLPHPEVPTPAATDGPQIDGDALVSTVADAPSSTRVRRVPRWPILIIALGAFTSVWSGWVGLGKLTGFGKVALLPGIADEWVIDSAITLPLGVESYAALAMVAWLSGAHVTARARRFARWSSIGALTLGAAGQVAYHLMTAAGVTVAPWPITAFVACLPVVVLGFAAALVHLLHHNEGDPR